VQHAVVARIEIVEPGVSPGAVVVGDGAGLPVGATDRVAVADAEGAAVVGAAAVRVVVAPVVAASVADGGAVGDVNAAG